MPVKDLVVVKTVPISPHAGKVTDALSRIGYSIEEAAADLIDNAIDAGATKVLLRFVHDGSEIRRILVADNGKGMTRQELLAAMQFGSARERKSDSLGKFGMGLKTAALSQGRSLTVVSRKRSRVSSCRWTSQSIASGWNCEVLDPKGAELWLKDIRDPFTIDESGTLVAIDGIEHSLTGNKGLEAALQRLQRRLSTHLGIVFHRFLDSGVTFYIDAAASNSSDTGFSVPVTSLDPFSYPVSGDNDYPAKFSIKLRNLPPLQCAAHIWPPSQSAQGYLLGGGNVVARQGFYFYRNNRLIQAGGWNGWRANETEHHLALARVAIELPPIFDTEFRLNVQKSGLDVPEAFRTALGDTASPLLHFVKRAEDVYRKKIPVELDYIPVPGRGFAGAVRRKAASYLAGKKMPKTEINVLWEKLPADRFFEIDRTDGNIRLNTRFRSDVLHGSQSRLNDVPVVKTLLFLLLRDDLLRIRESKRFSERLEEINELLMLAAEEEKSRLNT
jgi:hypothetical protein